MEALSRLAGNIWDTVTKICTWTHLHYMPPFGHYCSVQCGNVTIYATIPTLLTLLFPKSNDSMLCINFMF